MKDRKKIIWWRFEQKVSFHLEESIYWKLNEHGIKSFSFESIPGEKMHRILRIWLSANHWTDQERNDLVSELDALWSFFDLKAANYKWDQIKDENWSQSWKTHWSPDPVGKLFLILPAWLDLPEKYKNRIIVRLEPGNAFGTGSHPTTRLCLEALERNPPIDLEVVDLGCGSGILGLAALKIGAKKVFAIDIDPLAIEATKNNILLNHLPEQSLRTYLGSIDMFEIMKLNKKADLLICNTLAPIIKSLLPAFRNILKPEAKVLLSGLLSKQINEMKPFLEENRWKITNSFEKKDWCLIEIIQN